jgi:hypothetical protein
MSNINSLYATSAQRTETSHLLRHPQIYIKYFSFSNEITEEFLTEFCLKLTMCTLEIDPRVFWIRLLRASDKYEQCELRCRLSGQSRIGRDQQGCCVAHSKGPSFYL